MNASQTILIINQILYTSLAGKFSRGDVSSQKLQDEPFLGIYGLMMMKNKYSFFAIIFAILGLTLVSKNIKAQNLDINLLRDFNLNRNKTFDPALTVVTNSVAPLSFGTPLFIYGIGMLIKDSLTLHSACSIGLGIVSTSIINSTLKYTINRERPFKTYPDLDFQVNEMTPSFPSGHTSHAFALATSVSMAYPEWYVIAPSFLWASGVGYSRMHLGVHYPSDVLVGALVGSGSAYIGRKVNQWLARNYKNRRRF